MRERDEQKVDIAKSREGSPSTETLTPWRLSEPSSEGGVFATELTSAPITRRMPPISDSGYAAGVIPTMDWTSIPPLFKPAHSTSQRPQEYRQGTDVSKDFDDRGVQRIAREFAEFLIPRIHRIPTLGGVVFDLKVFYFQSMEERDLSLVRIELRVPGIKGSDRIELWKEYSRLIETASADFLSAIGRRSQKGQLFRKMLERLSEGVVST